MKHDETGKQRPEVAVPVTAVGTEAASRAVAGVRGHAVLLLSKLTFMLNALKKKFFFKVKKSKKSAGSPCSDLRGWLILSTPASILGSLRGPPRASRDQTLLPSSAHTPLSLPQPHQACGGGGRRVVAGAGNHSTGKSWPVGGSGRYSGVSGTPPPTDDTHSLPHADTCLPHSFPPPHACNLLPGGGRVSLSGHAGASSWQLLPPGPGAQASPSPWTPWTRHRPGPRSTGGLRAGGGGSLLEPPFWI